MKNEISLKILSMFKLNFQTIFYNELDLKIGIKNLHSPICMRPRDIYCVPLLKALYKIIILYSYLILNLK